MESAKLRQVRQGCVFSSSVWSRGGLGSLRGVEEVSFFKLSQKKTHIYFATWLFYFLFLFFNGQMFKIRALLLFTFGFLVCSVKSDSASGCCVNWYGATKDCSLCTPPGICRASIGNSISGPYTSTDGSTDCISFTISEADCVSYGRIFMKPSDNSGFGCPANISDVTTSCTIPSDFETPSGDFSMPSECVAGATIPHGFECTLTCPTGSHADAMGTHPSCTYGSFSGSVNCISSGVSADSTLLGLTSAIIVTLVLA